jgi:hypothetical protein
MKQKIHSNKSNKIFFLQIITLIIVSTLIGLNVFPTARGSSGISPPAGSINPSATSNTTGKIVFGRFYGMPKCNEIILLVRINGTASGYLRFPENNGTMNWTGEPKNTTVLYFDLNPAGGTIIDSGDYIEFSGLSPSTLYTFTLYHTLSYSLCSLFGPTEFGTPPNPPHSSDVTFDGTFPPMPTPIPDEKPSDLLPMLMIGISIVALASTIIYIGWKLTT